MYASRPHKGLQRGVLIVRRESKPAENAARRKKGHFQMETNYPRLALKKKYVIPHYRVNSETKAKKLPLPTSFEIMV